MEALKRGLPNPITTVAEYLGTDGFGFRWGPDFTAAGEGARVTLRFAAGAIVISSILLVVVPTYGIIGFTITGNTPKAIVAVV